MLESLNSSLDSGYVLNGIITQDKTGFRTGDTITYTFTADSEQAEGMKIYPEKIIIGTIQISNDISNPYTIVNGKVEFSLTLIYSKVSSGTLQVRVYRSLEDKQVGKIMAQTPAYSQIARPAGTLTKTSGTSWVVPDNVIQLKIERFSGSGGSGYSYSSSALGGNGGAGGYLWSFVDVKPGDVINYSLGSAGLRGETLSNPAGTDGGATSCSLSNIVLTTANGGKGASGVKSSTNNGITTYSKGTNGANASYYNSSQSLKGGINNSGKGAGSNGLPGKITFTW